MNPIVRLRNASLYALFAVTAAVLPVAVHAQSASSLSVDLVISAADRESFDGSLVIRNGSDAAITVEHPGNRMAHSFIVTSSAGNLVTPTPLTKVEPQFRTVAIPAKGEFRYEFRQLSFVSETGLFGYLLGPGNYRVIGIYRPAGSGSEGVSSPERLVTVPGAKPR